MVGSHFIFSERREQTAYLALLSLHDYGDVFCIIRIRLRSRAIGVGWCQGFDRGCGGNFIRSLLPLGRLVFLEEGESS